MDFFEEREKSGERTKLHRFHRFLDDSANITRDANVLADNFQSQSKISYQTLSLSLLLFFEKKMLLISTYTGGQVFSDIDLLTGGT